jgi:hypothetical protein
MQRLRFALIASGFLFFFTACTARSSESSGPVSQTSVQSFQGPPSDSAKHDCDSPLDVMFGNVGLLTLDLKKPLPQLADSTVEGLPR